MLRTITQPTHINPPINASRCINNTTTKTIYVDRRCRNHSKCHPLNGIAILRRCLEARRGKRLLQLLATAGYIRPNRLPLFCVMRAVGVRISNGTGFFLRSSEKPNTPRGTRVKAYICSIVEQAFYVGHTLKKKYILNHKSWASICGGDGVSLENEPLTGSMPLTRLPYLVSAYNKNPERGDFGTACRMHSAEGIMKITLWLRESKRMRNTCDLVLSRWAPLEDAYGYGYMGVFGEAFFVL